jgi:hypothetical protein
MPGRKKLLCMTHDLPRLAIASSIGGESMPSMDHLPRCPFEVEERKSQRNKRSLICSEGEPTLLSIHTDKDVEIAAPLLTRKGAAKRLIARQRAEQVQTGYTWTTDEVYLGNRRKSRRELHQRDKYGHLQDAQSSKAGRKKRK